VARSSRWEHALYASLGGLLLMLTASTIGFFMKRQKASVSKQQVWEPVTRPIEVSVQCQNSEAELEPSALSQFVKAYRAERARLAAT
jgi:hypothetical protein